MRHFGYVGRGVVAETSKMYHTGSFCNWLTWLSLELLVTLDLQSDGNFLYKFFCLLSVVCLHWYSMLNLCLCYSVLILCVLYWLGYYDLAFPMFFFSSIRAFPMPCDTSDLFNCQWEKNRNFLYKFVYAVRLMK